ncbi:hypothetical protein [Christiangramia echinicola]|uniref:hypothetical protein n=1 Tax=Christiangramia echinicola TaxID=279359 RepID=UPI0004191101|nr:hypothetical protein [Christiangramia echinicola]
MRNRVVSNSNILNNKKWKNLILLAFFITSNVIGQSLPKSENVKSVGGIGLDGDGNYRLAGRRALNKEKITPQCGESGLVAVYIEVDTSGNVLKAIPGYKGSTTKAKCLLGPSEQAALGTKFNTDSNAPLKQSGIIFYKYVFSEEIKNDLAQHNLNGQVWKIDEFGRNGEKLNTRIYNSLGYQILHKNFIGYPTTRFYYNDDNNVTESRLFSDNKLLYKLINKISNKRVVESKFFDVEEKRVIEIIQYKYLGADISEYRHFNPNGEVQGIVEVENSGGLVTKQTDKDNQGEIRWIKTLERNEKGDIRKELFENLESPNSSHKYSFEYEYDSNNNWIKRLRYSEEGILKETTHRNIVYFSNDINKEFFIEKWFSDEKVFLEFFDEEGYRAYTDKIDGNGGTWDLDTKQNLLILDAYGVKELQKFKYQFDYDGKLIVQPLQGQEKYELRL